MILSDILGYIGAFFLSCRFVPILYDQYHNSTERVNLYFLFLELGASAILINSYPFILCNGASVICASCVLVNQIRLRIKDRN
jgi:lipid-A-disaccharide synthase-like uncharacterized protein